MLLGESVIVVLAQGVQEDLQWPPLALHTSGFPLALGRWRGGKQEADLMPMSFALETYCVPISIISWG